MRPPVARIAQLVLVLAFPFLMVVASPGGFKGSQSILPVMGVEGVLLLGIAFANKERRLHEGVSFEEPAFKLGRATRRSPSGRGTPPKASIRGRYRRAVQPAPVLE